MVRCQELSDPVGSSLTKFVQYSHAASFHAATEETPMVSTDATAFALSPAEHQVQLRRAVIASTIGTAIEWYDFFLYSTVTGLVFAKLFFPNSDPWVGTLEAFAICRGLRRAAGGRCHLRPLRRPHRPKVDADR